MKYRNLGPTDLKISEFGFGCIPIIRLSTEEAIHVLRYALDKGINFFDTANGYHDSEKKIGLAFKHNRHDVVLATKSTMRDAVGITEHIENSLRMLQTDYLDLFQFHQVSKQEEWEEILGPKGAMEAVLKAQEQGKIRHVGITTHSNSMAIQFIKAELFDTIMVAFNFIEKSPQDEILGLTQKYNIGFLAMKPFAGGVLDNATLAFKFLRQFPTAVPLPGFDSTAQIDEILDLYKEPNIVTKEDFTLMEAYLKDLGSEFCRRCEYCQPCPNGVEITTAMSYPIMVKRMDVAATIAHAEKAMKSFRKCTFCYGCLNECPYKLLIPDILAKNYKMYLQHKNELRNN